VRRLIAVHLICILSLLAAPAAQARTLFDAGQADLETATVVRSQLPLWVQTVAATTPLYTSDSGADSAQRLPRNVFLRVLGGDVSRLQVEAYDENGNPGQRGWLDASQVLPSAPGTDWLVASAATPLWNSADASATAVRNLERFAPLQRIDGPLQNRMQVRVYRSDFTAVVDQGWVDVANTGPALPPQMRVASPTERPVGFRSLSSSNQQQAFLDATAQPARDAAALTGVPASVTVAQAILESDWGRSGLALNANNYFGMKVMGTLGNNGVVYMPTSEYDSEGQLYETVSAFRAYKSLTDSLADHDRLLQTGSRYATAMKSANDPTQFAALLAQAGYSTDPAYASKLVALMDRYNLYQLDKNIS
jgi:flagellum-specific peptidoglycan hydrolase FlgJ